MNLKINSKDKSIVLTYGGEIIEKSEIEKLRKKLSVYNLQKTTLKIHQGFAYLKDEENDQLKQLSITLAEKERVLSSLQKKLDSIPKINLFECQLTRHENINGQQKEEKTAVKKVGEQRTLFYKSITDGEFNLYKNHQKKKNQLFH